MEMTVTKCFLLLLLLMMFLATSNAHSIPTVDRACHAVAPADRTDCGFPGITDKQCRRSGCCYDDENKGYKFCFNKPNQDDIDKKLCQVVDPWQRQNCGYDGISQRLCEQRGCCYDESIPRVKFCFGRPDICDVEMHKRADCGYPGITQDECERKGCCFDTRSTYGPQCFYSAPWFGYSQTQGLCSIDGSDRRDCGFPGITEDQCKRQGCCFDSSDKHSIWCFYGRSYCNVGVSDRHDCGHPGISEDQCQRKGCCFDSSTEGSIWCFYGLGRCEVAVGNRRDCGHPGITEDQCKSQGCCFDSSNKHSIWCFYGNDQRNEGPQNQKEFEFAGEFAQNNNCGSEDSCGDRTASDGSYSNDNDRSRVSDDNADDNSYDDRHTCPYIPPNQRVDCGYEGISSRECKSRGCCFNSQQAGVIWCYERTPAKPPAVHGCSVPGHSRVDCGYPGIKESQCRKKKCCFDASQPDVPWCFYPKHRSNTGGALTQKYDSGDEDNYNSGYTCPYIQPNQRVDCGYEGISNRLCKSRGCCFNSQQAGVIWCYDRTPANPPGCSVPGKRRVDCGYEGIKSTECRLKGCCYDASQPNVPWCFYPKQRSNTRGMLPQKDDYSDDNSYDGRHTCPYIPPNQRVDCGYEGIPSRECKSRGCCFNNQQAGVIWCYDRTPANPPGCSVPGKRRVDCGYEGIKSTECRLKGCCFDASQPGVPWCFYPKHRSGPSYPQSVLKSEPAVDDMCGLIVPTNRVPCTTKQVTRRQCVEDPKCCYDNLHPDVPYCFKKPEPWQFCDLLPELEREECGQDETEFSCTLIRDCCYTQLDNGKGFCFQKRRQPRPWHLCTIIPEYNRVECGHHVTDQDECENDLHCCFDTTNYGKPFCYKAGGHDVVVKSRGPLQPPACSGPRCYHCDAIDVNERVACVSNKITRDECERKEKCCFDNTKTGVPNCFKRPEPWQLCKLIPVDERVKCSTGVNQDRCENSLGCCFDDTRGKPFCFQPFRDPPIIVPPPPTSPPPPSPPPTPSAPTGCESVDINQRVPCVSDKITRKDCEAKGCCFDNTKTGIPNCFRPPFEVQCLGGNCGHQHGHGSSECSGESCSQPSSDCSCEYGDETCSCEEEPPCSCEYGDETCSCEEPPSCSCEYGDETCSCEEEPSNDCSCEGEESCSCDDSRGVQCIGGNCGNNHHHHQPSSDCSCEYGDETCSCDEEPPCSCEYGDETCSCEEQPSCSCEYGDETCSCEEEPSNDCSCEGEESCSCDESRGVQCIGGNCGNNHHHHQPSSDCSCEYGDESCSCDDDPCPDGSCDAVCSGGWCNYGDSSECSGASCNSEPADDCSCEEDTEDCSCEPVDPCSRCHYGDCPDRCETEKLTVEAATSEDAVCFTIDPYLRSECGKNVVNKGDCKRLGCCFMTTNGSQPFCFSKQPKNDSTAGLCQNVVESMRFQCGPPGISEQLCLDRNCCYGPRVGTRSRCFKKIYGKETNLLCPLIDVMARQQCGTANITEPLCLSLGCCFDGSIAVGSSGFHCFKKSFQDEYCQLVNGTARQPCSGSPTEALSAEDCLANDCCYNDNVDNDALWCYKKRPAPSTCVTTLPENQRRPCQPGALTLTAESCAQYANCCYDPAGSDLTKYCYQQPIMTCDVRPKNRKNCEVKVKDTAECLASGCCSDPDTLRCYRKVLGYPFKP